MGGRPIRGRRTLALASVLLVSALALVWARGASTATWHAGAAHRTSSHAGAASGTSAGAGVALGGTRGRAVLSHADPVPAHSPFGILGHGSRCWFGDPRAVYVSGEYDETCGAVGRRARPQPSPEHESTPGEAPRRRAGHRGRGCLDVRDAPLPRRCAASRRRATRERSAERTANASAGPPYQPHGRIAGRFDGPIALRCR
jgi:hypothetical protein